MKDHQDMFLTGFEIHPFVFFFIFK